MTWELVLRIAGWWTVAAMAVLLLWRLVLAPREAEACAECSGPGPLFPCPAQSCSDWVCGPCWELTSCAMANLEGPDAA
jgi:hypothetical protein